MNTQLHYEILFIDFNVSDAQSLIDGLSSDIEIVLLDDKTNVLNQIAAVLDGYQNLDAIHIISDLVHSIATAYTLPVNVEHLIIDGKTKGNGTGNALDNRLIGNMAVNVLSGLAGNDTLDGGSGNDTLTGGDGNDTFIFSQGIKGNKNIDTVKDFVHGQDKIYLSADIFTKLAAAVGFASGSEPLSLAKADSHYLVSATKVKTVDTSSYLLYDTKTGVLAYDEDGSGKLVASSFVTLTGKPVITLDSLWIY